MSIEQNSTASSSEISSDRTLAFASVDIATTALGEGDSLVITLKDGRTFALDHIHALADQSAHFNLRDGSSIDTRQVLQTLIAQEPVTSPTADCNTAQSQSQPAPQHGTLVATSYDTLNLPSIKDALYLPAVDLARTDAKAKAADLHDLLHKLHINTGLHATAYAENTVTQADHAPDAQQLACFTPGAGDATPLASMTGGSANFGSVIEAADLNGVPPVGPIGETGLAFGVPFFSGSSFYALDNHAVASEMMTSSQVNVSGASGAAPAPVAPTVAITVDNGAPTDFEVQGSNATLPVHVTTTGDGAQTLTSLTVTGVGPEWSVQGWTPVSGQPGTYTMTLPAGIHAYDGDVVLVPTGVTGSDESDMVFTAQVTQAGQTAQDDAGIIVGTIDTPILTVPTSLTWVNYAWSSYTETLPVAASVVGAHETVNSITVDFNTVFDGLNPNHWSLNDMGATLNKGTETAPGIWTIAVNANDAAAALSGLKIDFPGGSYNDPASVAIHPNGYHDYHNTILQVTSSVTDTLSNGATQDVTITKNIGVNFGLTPLVIDLTGHGFNLTDNAHGVRFDMNNDGKADQTGWIGDGNGLLAVDLNHNGAIDNTGELFGNGSTSGFAILAQDDSNHDGVIDAKDAMFANLVVWQDANHDGVSQAGELRSLSDLGIASIGLNTADLNQTIGDSFIGQGSTVAYTDGHTTQVGDAWFNVTDSSMIGAGVRMDGSAGNDILTGTAQNDVLAGHGGNDTLIGNGGADVFLFDAIGKGYVATVQDFGGNDKIDLSSLLTKYDATQQSIDNFVHASSANGSTMISVDINGTGQAANFVDVATLQGVASASVDDLVAHNQLVAQHVASAMAA